MKLDKVLLKQAQMELDRLSPEDRAEFEQIRARFEEELSIASEADAKDFDRGPWWVRGIDALTVLMVVGLWIASQSQPGIWPWVMVIGGFLLAFIVPITARMIAAALSGAGRNPLAMEAITRFQEEIEAFSARAAAREREAGAGEQTAVRG